MPLQVALAEQNGIVTQRTLMPGRHYILGRSELADIVIPHPQVSRQHAILIAQNDDRWSLQDTSTTGCFIHGKPVSSLMLDSSVVLHFGPVACELTTTSVDSEMQAASLDIWQQSRLNALKTALADCADTQSLIDMAQNCFAQTLRCERTAVLLCDNNANISQATGYQPWMDESRFTGSRTVIRNAISQKQPLALGNIMQLDDYNTQQSVITNRIQAAVCIPLFDESNVIGVLYGDNISGRQYFTENEVAFARQIADLLSLRLLFHSIEHKLNLIRQS